MPINGFSSTEAFVTINYERILKTSLVYWCNPPFVYSLEENIVACTDSGNYSTEIGECVKGILIYYIYLFLLKAV